MQLRRIMAIALVTVLGLTGVAHAATKKPKPVPPSCLMVTSPSGDARFYRGTSDLTPANSSLDIVSADVASDGVSVTAAIRVKQLVAWTPTNAPTLGGRSWSITMHVGADQTLGFNAYDGPFGVIYTTASGKFDTANSEIRMSDPASKWPNLNLKKGTTLSGLSVTTQTIIQNDPKNTSSAGYPSYGTATGDKEDSAASSAVYTIGKPSCLKVAL